MALYNTLCIIWGITITKHSVLFFNAMILFFIVNLHKLDRREPEKEHNHGPQTYYSDKSKGTPTRTGQLYFTRNASGLMTKLEIRKTRFKNAIDDTKEMPQLQSTTFLRHLRHQKKERWGTLMTKKLLRKKPIQIYWTFYHKKIKIWDKKFWYFPYICSKHRLRVLVRTASSRRF